jgi:hypothetical protein
VAIRQATYRGFAKLCRRPLAQMATLFLFSSGSSLLHSNGITYALLGEVAMLKHETVDLKSFNATAELPFELRLKDFEIAMQDVYDFFFDVNTLFKKKGLPRLDDEVRPAIMSGLLSDMLTASLARHSRSLTQNRYFNGHPDLIVKGRYPNDQIKAGIDGVEIKTTRKKGGAVDTHGARDQWMCAFVYRKPQANVFYRSLSWLRHNGGFSSERAGRTRHAYGDAWRRRHQEATVKLDLRSEEKLALRWPSSPDQHI